MSDEKLREALELFRCQLIDGQIVKESDGEPWPLTKSEANQIVAELGIRLAALASHPSEVEAGQLRVLLRDVIDHFRGDFGESVGEELYGHGPGSEVSAGGQWLDRWLLRAESALASLLPQGLSGHTLGPQHMGGDRIRELALEDAAKLCDAHGKDLMDTIERTEGSKGSTMILRNQAASAYGCGWAIRQLAQRSDRGGEVTGEVSPAVITADEERVIPAQTDHAVAIERSPTQQLQTGRDNHE